MYLAGKKLYLSGPIEHDNTDHNWRTEPKKVLTNEFGINVFDPFDDPKQVWGPTLNKAREERDYDTMTRIARAFVRKDLFEVDNSHMLIANIPYKLATTGTCHEIINSNNAKKIVILVCEQGKEKIPAWYFGFVPHESMFGSWNEVYDYLREVDAGKHKHNDRWSVVYGMV